MAHATALTFFSPGDNSGALIVILAGNNPSKSYSAFSKDL